MEKTNRYVRKNKKMLSVYLNEELYELISKRAEFRNITLSRWVRIALEDLINKENKYL